MALDTFTTISDWALRTLSLFFAAVTPVALWYRFLWGGQSRIRLQPLHPSTRREWSSGHRRKGTVAFWSNYFQGLTINRGWWTGLIWDVELVTVRFPDGSTVENIEDCVDELRFEMYTDEGKQSINLRSRHVREGRSIRGRTIQYVNFVPFLIDNSEFTEKAKSHDTAEFVFDLTVEDNSGRYTTSASFSRDISKINASG